ncbi:MAG: hypothetical protein ABSE50_06080 [Xanthobacteraceae bacterium]|jgi:hypothetical protein
MEKLGGTIAAIAIAVSFAGVSSIQPAAAQTVAAAMPVQSPKITLTRAFDGVWSVSIATVNGACPASLRYPALIANGLVGMASGEFGYQISGAVYNTGGIIVTVSQNGQSATGRGRLSRLRGGGTWMTADRQCSGTWVADRRS